MPAHPDLTSILYQPPDRAMSTESPAPKQVEWLRGNAAILMRREMLMELAERYDLRGEMHDLAYFLQTREGQRKEPNLLLLPQKDGELYAAFLFEYRIVAGLKVFSTADFTGRRNVFAPPGQRALVASQAARFLLEHGAQVVHLSFAETFRDSRYGSAPADYNAERIRARVARVLGDTPQRLTGSWLLSELDLPMYLELHRTMDETLATLGKKTRTNLRYYRRRAERELGAHFVPEVHMTLAELLRFNRRCTFAVPDAVVKGRMEGFERMRSPFFCGLGGRDGHWLALAMGRRHHDVAELDWQMNRDDLPSSSLSTVMRAFLIEHEIERGTRRLFAEGGTSSSLGLSFVRQPVHELTLKRASPYVRVLHRVGSRLAPRRNYVAQLLSRSGLDWRPLGHAPRQAGSAPTRPN